MRTMKLFRSPAAGAPKDTSQAAASCRPLITVLVLLLVSNLGTRPL